MRLSHLFARTLREAPADAETASHRLLLPLGVRVQRKVEAIIRRELERVGGQEVLLPVLQPLELWQASGRDALYGPELYRLRDRRERGFALAPTHEEAVTRLVAGGVRSHRDLPQLLFQIQTKMRDEPRPRAGLLRTREFVMLDAYSFDAGPDGMDGAYEALRGAFAAIFEGCGLRAVPALADSGAIGGQESVEFILPAPAGEDTLVRCPHCGYAANGEKAEPGRTPAGTPGGVPGDAPRDVPPLEEVSTPGVETIESLAALLGVTPAETLKAVFYWATGPDAPAGALVFAGIRGDLAVNEAKLGRAVGAGDLRLATAAEVAGAGLVAGSASPVGVTGVRTVVDRSVPGAGGLVAGGNRRAIHLRHAVYGRDFTADVVADIATARAGDPCPRCGAPLLVERGIELGHIFKLGVRYSEALGARFLDASGRQQPVWMGCYGIGVGRTLAAAVEAGHDDRGIVWPPALAPFDVHLVALNADQPEVQGAAERLYADLRGAGRDPLLDDRPESAGVKLNDADLLGIPLRVTLGPRGLRQGEVELRGRTSEATERVPLEDAVARIVALTTGGATHPDRPDQPDLRGGA